MELSSFHVAVEIRARYDGMMMAVELPAWKTYDAMSPSRLAILLLHGGINVTNFLLREGGPDDGSFL